MAGVGAKTELLNVLSDVKARIQDKLGIVDFPMPQFILIGKQSVGKSRLIEALAGETFNFISGTLGSRRPTVLEFRNQTKSVGVGSRWFVRNSATNQWEQHPVSNVMRIVGDAHEECGESVSKEPIYVRIESPSCVDMQIVDLPGFRDFAMDSGKQELGRQIDGLVTSFMLDKRNVMLCVEQATDAANMSTLARCKEIDPSFERTVLIRNKLDKYYQDLTPENVNRWVEGFGDLPTNLKRFAFTLPWWPERSPPAESLTELREQKNQKDISEMRSRRLSEKYLLSIGFNHFVSFMNQKVEEMFVGAIRPVFSNLKRLKGATQKREHELITEFNETDPIKILSTTRDCGMSVATALRVEMEGVLTLRVNRMTLEAELRAFHAHHLALGSKHFDLIPSEEFSGLDDYIEYLRDDIQVGASDVEVNGGAQFRRLMSEVEIFLRFSEISAETTKRDVIQARGVSMGSLTWRDVVVKLLSNDAHVSLQRRVNYVGERIKWFFEQQKEPTLEFMGNLEGTASGKMHSALYPKHIKLINQNSMIKHLVFKTYDQACQRQLSNFVELFDNMLTSTFSNPWIFLKGASTGGDDEADGTGDDVVLPSFEDTKDRVPKEINGRSKVEVALSKWLQEIPTEASQIDTAVDRVQMLVMKTYSFIRSQVCDQVELFAESFFKLPMMRRLEEDMSMIDLSEDDKASYEARRQALITEHHQCKDSLAEIDACIERLQGFKLRCDARTL